MDKHSVEQDAPGDFGGDDLPSYANLAESQGPNSRFGRWKGWIEKRAAERYADRDPEQDARRRQRGWGESVEVQPSTSSSQVPSGSHSPSNAPTYSLTSNGRILEPTHASVHNFGSRFLPHSQYPIQTLLPIMDNRFLLLGTQEGLSMLDMFPRSSGNPEVMQGPDEAVRRDLWCGESIHQLALLEISERDHTAPQGVVLALVGLDPTPNPGEKEKEPFRTVRMYNLSSLASLALWAATTQDPHVVDVQHLNRGNDQSGLRRHRHQSSISKGFKSLVIDSPDASDQNPTSSFPQSLRGSAGKKPLRLDSDDSTDSQWDILNELPLRWATDFVPLAPSGSKLSGTSVNFFELWRNKPLASGPAAILAVATRNQILLYETPRGERAFKYMKDFYTPLPAKKLAFIHQLGDNSKRFSSRTRRLSSPISTDPWSSLSLFVVFDKKAGIIRVADSTVGEIEVQDEAQKPPKESSGLAPASFRRSISFQEHSNLISRELKNAWLVPTSFILPLVHQDEAGHTRVQETAVHLLSRAQVTYIMPSPLLNPIELKSSLAILHWQLPPTHIVARLLRTSLEVPCLQVVGTGDDGLEIQELALSFLLPSGADRTVSQASVSSAKDISFPCGFLVQGGAWSADFPAQEGIYGWTRKDQHDWRVFWVGDS